MVSLHLLNIAIHSLILNFFCFSGEDFRDDIEFQHIFNRFMLRVDMDIVAYGMNIDGRNGRGVERYNLESVLNIAADLLHIKSLNAQSGWPGNIFHLLTH